MPNSPKKPKIPTELEFDFIKSNLFRVVRADGFFGGLTPTGGNVHVGVYSERHPYPQKIFHKVKAGELGPEEVDKRQVRKGIVREIEVGITMDIAQVIVLRNWLNDRLSQYEQLVGPLPVLPNPPKVTRPKVTLVTRPKGDNGKGKK
jgi:hypothetical protein